MSQADEARELDWQAAAKRVDWMQILLNLMNGQETDRDGQPCFFIGGGYFCGRAKFWAGHDDQHKFVSLAALLARVRNTALEEAADAFEQEYIKHEGVMGTIRGLAAIRSLAASKATGGGSNESVQE